MAAELERDPWEHVERAAELILGAVAQEPSARLLEALKQISTAQYLAGRSPDRREVTREPAATIAAALEHRSSSRA